MLTIYDYVLADIDHWVAAHPAERGGALLGPIGQQSVTDFLFDDDAATSAAAFQPSQALNHLVQAWESTTPREFKGILHSHPGNFDRPSGQDLQSIEHALSVNPHLACYIAPIVTHADGTLASHELSLPSGKTSFFVAHRSRNGDVILATQPVANIPIRRDLLRLAQVYKAPSTPEFFFSDLGGLEVCTGRIKLPGDVELLLMVSDLYPGTPPVLLLTTPGSSTRQVDIPWPLDVTAEDRLVAAVSAVIPVGEGQICEAYGPYGGPAFTCEPSQAQLAHWSKRYTREDPNLAAETARSGLFARSGELVSEQLASVRVLLVGAGSVGSIAAEQFVRAGIGYLAVIDPDCVGPENLSRSTYEAQDVGTAKPTALARRLLQVNPVLDVTQHVARAEALGADTIAELIQAADLVFVATDDTDTQMLLNHFAYVHGTPAVFPALYDGAHGGEIVFTVPEVTACYLCAALTRQSVEEATPAVQTVDYSTGRLSAVVALAPDIHYVTSASVKVGLALLARAVGDRAGAFLDEPLATGQTYVFFSMAPNHWIFPRVMDASPGQYTWQSIWAAPVRRPECPVCGSPTERSSPGAHPLESPSIDRIREAASPGIANDQPSERMDSK